jgi:hypothetical protein
MKTYHADVSPKGRKDYAVVDAVDGVDGLDLVDATGASSCKGRLHCVRSVHWVHWALYGLSPYVPSGQRPIGVHDLPLCRRDGNSLPDSFVSNRESDLVDVDIGGKTAAEAPVTVGALGESFIRLARVDDLQGREPDPRNGDLFHLTDGQIEPVDGQAIRDRCQLEIDIEASG